MEPRGSLDQVQVGPAGGSLRDAGGATSARFCARPWGGYEVLEEGAEYKVKRLVVEPGHRLSLQRHRHRAEYWVVVAGAPRVIVSRRTMRLKPRGTVVVPRGAWHRIENPGKTAVVIIEVQQGAYLGEDDIIRRQDDYGRVESIADRARAPRARR